MKIAILHKQTAKAKAAAEKAKAKLTALGAEAFFANGKNNCVCDRVLVFGGDGTVLKAIRAFSEVPVIGVNYGTLGFLCEFRAGELDEACRTVLDENAAIIERTMLETQVNGTTYFSLNEIALLRRLDERSANRVAFVSVEIDEVPYGTITADGVILSTPTGSTAYSLSAGGSVLSPDCEDFLLTPVCPLPARQRPFVFSDKREVKLGVERGGELLLYCDGICVVKTTGITAKKAKRTAKFITRNSGGFFRRFMEKIN